MFIYQLCYLPSFFGDPHEAFICRYLNTVDAAALRATCREVRGDMASCPWCGIVSMVWGYSETQRRACFPHAQGYNSVIVIGVIYAEDERLPL